MSFKTLVNHDKKFILFWNEKVACSYLKRWYLESIGTKRVEESGVGMCDVFSEDFNVHGFITKNNSKFSIKRKNLNSFSNYKKLIVIRSPFDRLSSYYRDKVILNSWSKTDNKSKNRNRKYRISSDQFVSNDTTTFFELVKMIRNIDDTNIEPHLKSQAHNIEGIEFDHVINIDDKINLGIKLSEILGINIKNKRFNQTSGKSESRGCEAKYQEGWGIMPFKFDKNSLPQTKDLFNLEIKKIVLKRYAKDFGKFKNYFNTNLV